MDQVAVIEIMVHIDRGGIMRLAMLMTSFTPIDTQSIRPHHILTISNAKLTKTAIRLLATTMSDTPLPRIVAIMAAITTITVTMEVVVEVDEATAAIVGAGPLLSTFRIYLMAVSNLWQF